jgi:hypothetical protein
MEERDQRQKELFEFEKPKRRFPSLKGLFPKADFEGRVLVTLTPEQIILISIGILMSLVVIYAVGVEQGSNRNVEKPAAVTISAESQLKKAQSFFSTTQVRPPAPLQALGAVKAPAVAGNNAHAAAVYTVIAATYKSMDSAVQAVDILRRDGLAAYLMKKGAYTVICVGAYTDSEGAQVQADLVKVRAKYKDAYIKSR